jgi:hypothetical protein
MCERVICFIAISRPGGRDCTLYGQPAPHRPLDAHLRFPRLHSRLACLYSEITAPPLASEVHEIQCCTRLWKVDVVLEAIARLAQLPADPDHPQERK